VKKNIIKCAYRANYPRTCSTDLNHILSFDRHLGGMISLTFVLRSLKERCYGNQLIWGAFCKHQNLPPSVFAMAFQSEMQYRHTRKGVKTGDDAAISYKNLVNFGAVTIEITFFVCVPSYGYCAKICLRSPFIAL